MAGVHDGADRSSSHSTCISLSHHARNKTEQGKSGQPLTPRLEQVRSGTVYISYLTEGNHNTQTSTVIIT